MARPAGINRRTGWPGLLLLATVLLAVLAPPAHARARSPHRAAGLTIRFAGLPGPARGIVVVSGRGGARRLGGSGQLRGLAPGVYRLQVLPVHLHRIARTLPRGGTAYPARPRMSVTVRRGATAHLTVLYGTVESAAARRMTWSPRQVGGSPTNPRWIAVPRSSRISTGTILVARPSRTLPAGLFHLVVHLRHVRGVTRLILRPARVSQVYPSLYLDGRLPLVPPASAPGGRSSPPLQWSLSNWSGACAAHADGAYSNTVSVRPTLRARRFYLHNGEATGALMAGLTGSVAINLPVTGSSSCSATRSSNRAWQGFLTVRGTVPVPYYLQPSFLVNWSASGAFTLSTTGSVSVDAGLRFARRAITPVFSGRSELSGSLAHEATVAASGGLEARWGLGLPQATLTYLAVTPTEYGSTGPCSTGGQVMLKGAMRGLHVSRSYQLVDSRCPQHTLTVSSAGSGQGSVNSDPGGIGCTAQCSVNLDDGTQVTVTAAPATGSTFSGWSGGGCAGTGPCTMTLSSDESVTANFAATSADQPAAADPSGPARHQLVSLLQNPSQATGSAREPTDGTGHTLDTIKIIPSPTGGYLGVYHALVGTTFQVRLATSADLLHWTYKTTLDQNASQPTFSQLADGSFLVIDEKSLTNGTSHLHFADYASLATLMAANPALNFDAPLTLSSSHEGTPDIRAVSMNGGLTSSEIQIGFHYLDGALTGDREAIGTLTNFSTWSAHPNDALNSAFNPVPANIGDRDFINFHGYPFTILESQLAAGDWSTWRISLYDETAGRLTPLTITTAAGSRSFANPSVTALTDPAGHAALAVSYFLPYQGAAPSEAGPLVFYTEY